GAARATLEASGRRILRRRALGRCSADRCSRPDRPAGYCDGDACGSQAVVAEGACEEAKAVRAGETFDGVAHQATSHSLRRKIRISIGRSATIKSTLAR